MSMNDRRTELNSQRRMELIQRVTNLAPGQGICVTREDVIEMSLADEPSLLFVSRPPVLEWARDFAAHHELNVKELSSGNFSFVNRKSRPPEKSRDTTLEHKIAEVATMRYNPGEQPDIAKLMRSAFELGYAQALIDRKLSATELLQEYDGP